MDVLIVLALLRLGAGSVDWTIGESFALLQSGRDGDSVNCSGLLVFLPGGPRDVSTDDSFDGKNTQLAHLHCPVLQYWLEGSRDLGREVESEEVGAQSGNAIRQDLEPRLRAESEENALVGDAL
jgi:hypothetical protein